MDVHAAFHRPQDALLRAGGELTPVPRRDDVARCRGNTFAVVDRQNGAIYSAAERQTRASCFASAHEQLHAIFVSRSLRRMVAAAAASARFSRRTLCSS